MTKYHLVGIGGIGMSGLARLLKENGIEVTGSDLKETDAILELKQLGIPVFKGHKQTQVPQGASVVYSSGIGGNNPELENALPKLHRSQLLDFLMQGKKQLLVTGTHGKTTTSSLLATVFGPSYAIGGVLAESGLNAKKGESQYFIAEADESDGSFLNYHPFGAIITNIDNDHMDYYKSEKNLLDAFKEFSRKTSSKKHLFYCSDDSRLKECIEEGVSYGFQDGAMLKGSNFRQDGWKIFFDASFEGENYLDIEVPLIGSYNALNALAVFGLALSSGISEEKIRCALKAFKGVKRRLEFKGKSAGIEVRDDYGHHPTEIKATLRAVRNVSFDDRTVVIFQPHRFSRTKECLQQFKGCFDDADAVYITDIYAAGESPLDIHAKDVVEAAANPNVKYLSCLQEIELRPFDRVLTMGAGDVWKMGIEILENPKIKKWTLGLVFGGQSQEHEISLLSCKNIARGIDRSFFQLKYFYISKEGVWKQLQDVEGVDILSAEEKISPDVLKSLYACDVLFPVLHGPNGEDGRIQGFFDMLNLPYVGCDHISSAICMDKLMTKKLAEQAGILTAPFLDFSLQEWKKNEDSVIEKVINTLNFPVYVKPIHLGSTLGVAKASNLIELKYAFKNAFENDYHLIVEKEIKGREIEFSVLGDFEPQVFPPGEILSLGKTYDYASKYGINGFETKITAEIPCEIVKKGMEIALKAYKSVGCNGYARVDCFLQESGEIYLNEINPIPGFTESSLYPKMCEKGGLELPFLLSSLVRGALARSRLRERFL